MSQRQSRIDWVQSVLGVPISAPSPEMHASEGGNETPLQSLRRRVKEAIQSVGALSEQRGKAIQGAMEGKDKTQKQEEIKAFDETIQVATATNLTLTDINQKLGVIDQAMVPNDAPVEQYEIELRPQIARIKTIATQGFDVVHVGPGTEHVSNVQPDGEDNLYWTEDERTAYDLAEEIEKCLTETNTHADIRQAMPAVLRLIEPISGEMGKKALNVDRRDPKVVKDKLTELEAHCVTIDQDTRSYMNTALEALRKQVPAFDAVNPINQVAQAAEELGQRANGLASTMLKVAMDRLWIARAAKSEADNASDASKAKAKLDKIVGKYDAQMEILSGAPSAVKALADFKNDILFACVREKSVYDLADKWKDLAGKGVKKLAKVFQQATVEAVKPEQLIEGLDTMSKAFDKLVKTLPPEILAKIVGGWGLDSKLSKDPNSLKPEMLTKVINETINGAGKDKDKLTEINTALQKALTASFDQILTGKSSDSLDAFIVGIGDKVTFPVSQPCCVAALKKRFGMEITIPEGVQITRLPELYTMMKRLPEGHVSPKNTKMQRIEYEASSGASDYGAGKITLNHMATKVAPYIDLDQPDKQVELDYFSAVTLHEIGHSVDDANTVMSGKMNNEAFGGWLEVKEEGLANMIYDAYLSKVAVPVDVSLVKDLARSAANLGRFIEPRNSNDSLFPLAQYWEEFRKTGVFDAILSAANVQSQSWRQPFLKNNERAYHQSYQGKWVSYLLSQRNSKAVSVYQYRAPGEWFAEIYARYHVAKPGAEGDPDRDRVKTRVGESVIAFVT